MSNIFFMGIKTKILALDRKINIKKFSHYFEMIEINYFLSEQRINDMSWDLFSVIGRQFVSFLFQGPRSNMQMSQKAIWRRCANERRGELVQELAIFFAENSSLFLFDIQQLISGCLVSTDCFFRANCVCWPLHCRGCNCTLHLFAEMSIFFSPEYIIACRTGWSRSKSGFNKASGF